MSDDKTPEQVIESVLHSYGMVDSKDIAQAVVEELGGMLQSRITPTMGPMGEREHMAFILRVFLYLVEIAPTKHVRVSLEDVLTATAGRQIQVRLDGSIFEARSIADLRIGDGSEL